MMGSKKRKPVGRPVGSKNKGADPKGLAPSDRVHITIEPLTKGHLITHSGMKDGKYTETKTYSPTAPVIAFAGEKRK